MESESESEAETETEIAIETKAETESGIELANVIGRHSHCGGSGD